MSDSVQQADLTEFSAMGKTSARQYPLKATSQWEEFVGQGAEYIGQGEGFSNRKLLFIQTWFPSLADT